MRRYLILMGVISVVVAALFIQIQDAHRAMKQSGPRFKVEGNRLYYRTSEDQYTPYTLRVVTVDDRVPKTLDEQQRRELYATWFEAMQAIGVNTMNLPYLLESCFYETLMGYNEKRQVEGDEPLYILQGIPIEESWFAETVDSISLQSELLIHIKKTVDAIHANLNYIEHFDEIGEYPSDISPYVVGYQVGNGLSSEAIIYKNIAQESTNYKGVFIETEDTATPYEAWLACVIDTVVSYNQTVYGDSSIVQVSQVIRNKEQDTATPNYVDINALISTDNEVLGLMAGYELGAPIDSLFEDTVTLENIKAYYFDYAKLYVEQSVHPVLFTSTELSTSREMYNQFQASGLNNGIELLTAYIHGLSNQLPAVHTHVGRWQDYMSHESWHNIHSQVANSGLIGMQTSVDGIHYKMDGQRDEWGMHNLIEANDLLALYAAYDTQYMYMAIEDKRFSKERQQQDATVRDQLVITIDTLPNTGDPRMGGADVRVVIDEERGQYDTHEYANVYKWLETYDAIKARPDLLSRVETSINWSPFLVTAIAPYFDEATYQPRVAYPAYHLKAYAPDTTERYHIDYALTEVGVELRLSWEMLVRYMPFEEEQAPIVVTVGKQDTLYTPLLEAQIELLEEQVVQTTYYPKARYQALLEAYQQKGGQ